PNARAQATLFYDPAAGAMILFGGDLSSPRDPPLFGLLNDSYTYSSGIWTPLSLSGAPSPRAAATAAFDPPNGTALLLGGWYYAYNATSGSGGYTELGDTWVLSISNSSWTPATALHLTPSRTTGEVGVDLTIRATGVIAPSGTPFEF